MPFIHYSATIQDFNGTQATVVAYSNPADLTGEPAGLNAWLSALDGIINGIIVKSRLIITPLLPTTLNTAGRTGFADSLVEACCTFRFTATGSTHLYSQAVPAFADTLITLGKPNLTAAAVATYTALTDTAPYTNANGQTLNGLRSAYLAFHKHRRQLQKSSLAAA